MRNDKGFGSLGLPLALAILLLVGCSAPPPGQPTPAPITAAPTETLTTGSTATSTPSPAPAPTEVPTPTTTSLPITEADLESSLQTVREAMTLLAEGEFRQVYGSYLSTGGQQRLAELILGRLALPNPHISFFELLGAEPTQAGVAVDLTWQETHDGQGLVGAQSARVFLVRQGDAFLIDDVQLAEYRPAATPIPQPKPRAEALTNLAVPGEEMRFRASGFQSDEMVLTWLELPDGSLTSPAFQKTNAEGAIESVYSGELTRDLAAGRWIWWAQALRDSARNTGITFEVLPAPTATPAPTSAPTRRPATATPASPRPTATPAPPSTAYPAPQLLWPEAETSRNFRSSLVVEFVPVAPQLAADEFYQMVLVSRDLVGNIHHAGSVLGKGGPCSGKYEQPCVSLTADERFMSNFHLDGVEGQGTWFVQVVKQTGADQFTPISPPSESRIVILKPRS